MNRHRDVTSRNSFVNMSLFVLNGVLFDQSLLVTISHLYLVFEWAKTICQLILTAWRWLERQALHGTSFLRRFAAVMAACMLLSTSAAHLQKYARDVTSTTRESLGLNLLQNINTYTSRFACNLPFQRFTKLQYNNSDIKTYSELLICSQELKISRPSGPSCSCSL